MGGQAEAVELVQAGEEAVLRGAKSSACTCKKINKINGGPNKCL